MENNTQNNENYGELVMQVSTASGAIPVEGATVVINRMLDEDGNGGNETLYVLKTDSDGKTEKVRLPAKPSEMSQSPGNGTPYLTYLIRVDADGYYPVTFNGVPIFENVVSVQSADLIPLPENGYSDRVADREIFYENENPDL